jgi:hypothetical protein
MEGDQYQEEDVVDNNRHQDAGAKDKGKHFHYSSSFLISLILRRLNRQWKRTGRITSAIKCGWKRL